METTTGLPFDDGGDATVENSPRRRFLRQLAAGGGLLVGLSVSGRAATLVGGADLKPTAAQTAVTAWVRITPGNEVMLIVSQAEIGQGISTTLPAVLADELGADWASVKLATAPFDPAFGNPARGFWMFTGNSESVQAFYDHMRRTGAAARSMLVDAAANRWRVSASECDAQGSAIVHRASGRQLTFGDVAADAAKLPVPEKPPLKAETARGVDGKALPRVDVPAKVDGTAIFGIDYSVSDMLVAAVRTAPEIGGKLASFDASKVKDMPGVVAVLPLPNGVAVVAKKYWQARRALLAMPIEFDAGPNAALDSATVRAEYHARLESGPFATPVDEGDADAALADAERIVSADYENPFLAHATMEPMNCTAAVTKDRCEIWAPTQGQNLAFFALKQALGLPDDRIVVNRTPYIGGGFGRRLLPDFVVQAALISRSVGRPVKVIWDREEDMRRDSFRPASLVRLRAAMRADGLPSALAARVVSPTILLPVFPAIQPMIQEKRIDPSALEGMLEMSYAFPRRRVDFHLLETPIPSSVLRTTGFGPNTFALESFVDELAHAAKQDPYRYRRKLLAGNTRGLAVLDRAAKISDWGKPLPKGHGCGMAYANAFGSFLATVLEVEVSNDAVRVHRAWMTVDCGRVLDPGIATRNIEGGTVFGLAGCKSEITFARGRIEQENFNRYTMPYLAETPQMHVEFIDGGGALGGVGEIGPVTAPAALANAIFAACGTRIRSLPLARNGLHLA
ncbi:MAG TPA: molybdopterin cofactor-binding domain-containing protein [Rudaea sp.]|nr:molybdopterin cofactor-binding domain-containing protein [Rudaea sp.]